VIAGNHKPAIRNVDEVMKRRLHLIPFTVTIPLAKRDGRLSEKLLAERDGILAWAVADCLDWQRIGLQPPACVVSATEEYFETEDALGQWIDERCLLVKTHRVGISELFADWREWAERAGEYVGSVKRFSEMMATRKFEKCRLHGGARGLTGIAVQPKPHHGYSPYGDN
jgi:putative DNA primase/helicase